MSKYEMKHNMNYTTLQHFISYIIMFAKATRRANIQDDVMPACRHYVILYVDRANARDRENAQHFLYQHA